MPVQIPFTNLYATLPEHFYAETLPTPVQNPQLISFNYQLAEKLGIQLENCSNAELAQLFSGNLLPTDSFPIALAYAGHQFGHLNPQLGDGRAVLLGDLLDSQGRRRDIQLKGSGRTPFSRNGDGRSPLGPVLREYLLCEGMHALGVPTTRALAAVTSGEQVYRHAPEPGAVFTRVAASHIRVGTFVYFAIRGDTQGVQRLADHVLERQYPEIDTQATDRYVQLFTAICRKQAELVAWWMQLGFVHGVMNTDNMTVSGEGIDYGPCAFLESYRAKAVFSSIDQHGRYAFINQPSIAQWNLARLAETLLQLFDSNEQTAIEIAKEILSQFAHWQHEAWLKHMRAKLGFAHQHDGDEALILQLLQILEAGEVDYSLFMRRLSLLTHKEADRQPVLALAQADQHAALHQWLDTWQELLFEQQESKSAAERIRAHSPAIIPRNHRVAEAIAAAEAGDLSVFNRLLAAITQPYADTDAFVEFQQPAQPEQRVQKTFCGT